MVLRKETISTSTSNEGLWRGIGGSHSTIQYILAEFVDDSISSIMANNVKEKKVIVTISERVPEKWNADYLISVEDSGAGIKDLSAAFSFANTSAGETSLNKYGVGLKKALATLDVCNEFWTVMTRSEEDYEMGTFKLIEAPYSTDGMEVRIIQDEPWKGLLTGTGTLVMIPCSKALLTTAGKDYPTHSKLLNHLAECITEEGVIIG